MMTEYARLAKLVRDNFIAKASCLAKHTAKQRHISNEHYVRVDCGLPSDTFNVTVMLKQQLQMSDMAIIDEAVHYFTKKNFPMALWCWEDSGSVTYSTLRTAGLAEAETNIAMHADLERLHPEKNQLHSFTIREATSPEEVLAFGEVLAGLFGSSEEAVYVRAYFNQLSPLINASRDSAMKLYIGRFHQEVVSCGSLLFTNDSVGIYDIATKREFRGRGFGSAMFSHLLAEARQQPVRNIVLLASPDGINIYRRAGFEPVGEVKVFENCHLIK